MGDEHAQRASEIAQAEGWRGSVFLWRERGLFLGSAGDTTAHAPHAIKIAIAVHGEMRLRAAESRRWQSFKSAAIAPDYPHQLNGERSQIALFYLIPETTEAQRVLESSGNGRHIFALPHRVVDALTPRLRTYLNNGCSNEEASALCDELVEGLTATRNALDRKRDPRIVHALEHLRAAHDHHVRLQEIASTVALSPDRFAHLFRQEAGLPLRRYLLWSRLRAAIEQMASSDNVTTAAIASGFADSAHFSRTFRRMMGLAPSLLMRNSRFNKRED